ncbi:CFC_HP_G0068230.mRNA.1.CDS.1 [Saccharomyces cerevisiae]|nr:CFC_HP_G0068230.mRNA.1.CDS.1 [Saccharomyces cerevisiae]CAI6647672.1 CFC_HP_G0068230.mRNA.1.CDS.1 [Saccharomyces cerevisiae]
MQKTSLRTGSSQRDEGGGENSLGKLNLQEAYDTLQFYKPDDDEHSLLNGSKAQETIGIQK